MIRKLAEELMIHVYYPVSAVVSMDDQGNCLAVRMFDTLFAGDCMVVHPDAAVVYLMSNHPEGRREPYPQDLENLEALKAKISGIEIRLIITGEDIGCIEISFPT